MSGPMEAQEAETELGATLVLNALRDVVEDSSLVLEDEASRALVEDAFEAATGAEEREAVSQALHAAGGSEQATGDGELWSAVGAVVDELSGRGVEVRLDHRVRVAIDPRQAGLFNAIRSGETALLESVDLDPAVLEGVLTGVDQLGAGRYAQAADVFQRAIGAADGTDDELVPRVLAGWACLQDGDEAGALASIEPACGADEEPWASRMVEVAAEAASPELFRDGVHGIGSFLRARAEVPGSARIGAAIGPGDGPAADSGGWTDLPGSIAFFDVDRLWPSTHLRLELRGPIGSLPVIHAYYLAMGVIDRQNEVPRSVEHLFLTGPETADTDERLRFDSP